MTADFATHELNRINNIKTILLHIFGSFQTDSAGNLASISNDSTVEENLNDLLLLLQDDYKSNQCVVLLTVCELNFIKKSLVPLFLASKHDLQEKILRILFLLSCYECSLNSVHINDPVSVIGALQKLKVSLTSAPFFRELLVFLGAKFAVLANGVDEGVQKAIGVVLSLLANLLMVRDEYQVGESHLLEKYLHNNFVEGLGEARVLDFLINFYASWGSFPGAASFFASSAIGILFGMLQGISVRRLLVAAGASVSSASSADSQPKVVRLPVSAFNSRFRGCYEVVPDRKILQCRVPLNECVLRGDPSKVISNTVVFAPADCSEPCAALSKTSWFLPSTDSCLVSYFCEVACFLITFHLSKPNSSVDFSRVYSLFDKAFVVFFIQFSVEQFLEKKLHSFCLSLKLLGKLVKTLQLMLSRSSVPKDCEIARYYANYLLNSAGFFKAVCAMSRMRISLEFMQDFYLLLADFVRLIDCYNAAKLQAGSSSEQLLSLCSQSKQFLSPIATDGFFYQLLRTINLSNEQSFWLLDELLDFFVLSTNEKTYVPHFYRISSLRLVFSWLKSSKFNHSAFNTRLTQIVDEFFDEFCGNHLTIFNLFFSYKHPKPASIDEYDEENAIYSIDAVENESQSDASFADVAIDVRDQLVNSTAEENEFVAVTNRNRLIIGDD